MIKNVSKSIIAVIICAILMTTAAPFAVDAHADNPEVTNTSTKQKKTYKVKKKLIPFYFLSPEQKFYFEVYYVNGLDVPYMEINDIVSLFKMMMPALGYTTYDLDVKVDGYKVTLTRENEYFCDIDFKKDQLYFLDYNGFIKKTEENSIVDAVNIAEEDGLLKRLPECSTSRFGSDITLDLGSYNIDLVRKGKKYFIPVQIISDLFFAGNGITIMYNGKVLIMASGGGGALIDSEYNKTAFGKIYYKSKLEKETISPELAEFNYNELCFVLDNLYGLKENHNITSFDELMRNTGLKEMMLSGNTKYIEYAMYMLLTRYLDDVHTKYGTPNPAAGYKLRKELIEYSGEGMSRDEMFALEDVFKAIREQFYPDGVPGYEEIGDTAYITFDEFSYNGIDYYQEAPTNDPSDTIGLIAYSVQQILRENSPVKNVVLDLSCNGGGTVDTAVYTIGAFLGYALISLEDAFTGALSTTEYLVDTNLDHEFDEKDYLVGKGINLYCLTSGVSFSCGNLVPCMFKQSPEVSLIGQPTSGGACSVLWLTTAIGSTYRLSSQNRVSFMKNGSFYDVDRGADPDFYLGKKDSFYDREKLTEYIDSLM